MIIYNKHWTILSTWYFIVIIPSVKTLLFIKYN